MFTKAGIRELHEATHDSLDILFRHVATVPDTLLCEHLVGFGFPTVLKQLVHILVVEDGWVHDLQNKEFADWREGDSTSLTVLLGARARIRDATRVYLDSLSEVQ